MVVAVAVAVAVVVTACAVSAAASVAECVSAASLVGEVEVTTSSTSTRCVPPTQRNAKQSPVLVFVCLCVARRTGSGRVFNVSGLGNSHQKKKGLLAVK